MPKKQKNKKESTKKPTVDNKPRFPRPAGTTQLSIAYREEPENKRKKERLQKHVIQHWLQGGMTYCGEVYSTEQMASITGLSNQGILKEIIRSSNVLDRVHEGTEGLQSLGRAILFQTILGSLGDRARAIKQYNILDKAQNGTYQPFISGSVNEAIRGLQGSHKPILDMMKLLMGNDPTTIINLNNQNNQLNLEEAMTPEKALELMRQHKGYGNDLLNDPNAQLQLAEEYGDSIPDISPNPQSEASNSPKKPSKIPKRPKHEERREEDGEIVPRDTDIDDVLNNFNTEDLEDY